MLAVLVVNDVRASAQKRVHGLGSMAWGPGFGVQGSGFRFQDLGWPGDLF